RLGFLDVGVENGLLETTTPISLAVALKDPDGTNLGDAGDTDRGRITLKELADNILSPGNLLATPTIAGALKATLPLSASIGSLSIPASSATTLIIELPDLSDPTNVNVTPPSIGDDFKKLLEFRNMSAAQFVSLIAGLTSQLEGLRNASFV